MRITLISELEKFVEKQTQAHGYHSPSEYIGELVRNAKERQTNLPDWKRRLEERLGIRTQADRDELRRQIEQGAARNAERDLTMAEEWFPLEEESHGEESESETR